MEFLFFGAFPQIIRNCTAFDYGGTCRRLPENDRARNQPKTTGILLETLHLRRLPQRSRRVHFFIYRSDGKVFPGDPGMMFFEVQLLILRLAWECYPKDLEKKNLGMVL